MKTTSTEFKSPIRAVIFDLDNCLAAADQMGRSFYEPAFDAIREANHGKLSDAELDLAFHDCWRHALDFVAQKHGFSQEMLTAGWRVSAQLEVHAPMHGYGDLDSLERIPVIRFLVTSGFRRLQESKIKALGIAPLFTSIHVDALDEPNRKGKQAIFAEIMESHQLKPEETLVVGDNPDSEIAAGNRLGIVTVQILRPGVPRGENACHYISDFDELARLLIRARAEVRSSIDAQFP